LNVFSRFVLIAMILPSLFIAGVQLFVLSGQTETYFAWTIAAPIVAAFMGASYWAAMVHNVLALREGTWAYVRSSLPGALAATTLIAITTLLHLDKFHFASPLLITRFVTWVWVFVYITVPPSLAIAWIVQSRQTGARDKVDRPLPTWIRAGFGLLAAFSLLSGLALFLLPEAAGPLWPFALTPLAARAVGSFLSAFGVVCATLAIQNETRHGSGTGASLFAFCILQLVVVARFPAAMDWSKPLAILYVLFFLTGLIITGAHILASRRP
jgi:hypothetical protein